MSDAVLHTTLADIRIDHGGEHPLLVSIDPARGPALETLEAAVARYTSELDAMFDLTDLHIIFARQGTGPVSSASTSRVVYARDIHPIVADASSRLGLKETAIALAVFEPDFVAKIGSYDDARMREIISSDFGAIVAGCVNLRGNGPVVGLLPWLVALAGSVVAHKVSSGDGAAVDRAITKIAHAFSLQVAPDANNAFSRMTLRHPDFLPVLDIVGRNAFEASSDLPGSRVPFHMVCEISRRAVLDALGSVGVNVEKPSRTA